MSLVSPSTVSDDVELRVLGRLNEKKLRRRNSVEANYLTLRRVRVVQADCGNRFRLRKNSNINQLR